VGVQLELLLLLERQLVVYYLHWKRLHLGKINLYLIAKLMLGLTGVYLGRVKQCLFSFIIYLLTIFLSVVQRALDSLEICCFLCC
jgi:hypothetical protein